MRANRPSLASPDTLIVASVPRNQSRSPSPGPDQLGATIGAAYPRPEKEPTEQRSERRHFRRLRREAEPSVDRTIAESPAFAYDRLGRVVKAKRPAEAGLSSRGQDPATSGL